MRRSMSLRIVAFVLLLGMIGVIAAGCTGFIEVIIEIGPQFRNFFDAFAREIYYEDARDLANRFYASYVYVDPVGREVSRDYVYAQWRQYFRDWDILDSQVTSTQEEVRTDRDAWVTVKRFEVRRYTGEWESETRPVTELYHMRKIGDSWRIVEVYPIEPYSAISLSESTSVGTGVYDPLD